MAVPFGLDDASWDIDGRDKTPEFSPLTIQSDVEQLHRNLKQVEADTTTDDASVCEPDDSVSTLQLDVTSRSSPTSGSSSPQFFTPIDLPLPDVQPNSSLELDSESPTNAHADANHLTEDVPAKTDSVYPVVHIDVSQPPSKRIHMTILDGTHVEDHMPVEVNGDSSFSSRSPSQEPAKLTVATSASLCLPLSVNPAHQLPRSPGSSTFQKVVSKTRPHFLPPKSREEDQKHLADWEAMMRESRAAEDRRRKTLQEHRLARELKIAQSMPIWEKEILPDWRVVHRNPTLRKLWWNGIPTKLRPVVWERAAGNMLALSKDNYRNCLSRARRALSSGVFPSDILQEIEEDIDSTLPAVHIFQRETGPLYQELKDILCAWVISRADEGLGYIRGIAKIAAMILINIPAPQAFIATRNLLERHCLRSFYGGTGAKEDVEAYYRIFDTLLADSMPKIYFNFKQHQISPAAYLPDWLVPLFLDHLPFEACARLWDVILLEGDSFLFRAALAILAVLEPRLFFPDRDELLQLLKGKNKAALEVARREGLPLNGGKYEIYGVDEESLWEQIDSMEDWWRESTWKRLTLRELPDV
ncbi:hypothetical protein ID866_2024 [Astraeus odoratus]|nr:hypothetical protein ID866_2024 [Astraeus odoratus]